MLVMGLEKAMDKVSRALRRYHRRRMHNRAAKMVQEWCFAFEQPWDTDPKEFHKIVAKRRDHMCSCSCSGCGNQRRNKWNPLKYRLTLAERRNNDVFMQQMDEIG